MMIEKLLPDCKFCDAVDKAKSLWYSIRMKSIIKYIQTGKIKPVSRQLLANPKAELCAFHNGIWLRVAGS